MDDIRKASAACSAACRLALWVQGSIELDLPEVERHISQLELLAAVAAQLAKRRS